MMTYNDDHDLLLVRYFSGELSDVERTGVERTYQGSELERMHAVWEASAEPEWQPDVAAALHRLKAVRAERANRPVLTFPQATTSSITTRVLQIAAVIALLITGGLVLRDRTRAAGR